MSDAVAVIRVYSNEMEAIMAQQVLAESGVTAFVFTDDAGGMEPQLQRTSGVRLVVSRADAERASEILQTLISS
jgi:hypothetical protein